MVIYLWVKQLVEGYSFINKVEYNLGYFRLYYTKNGKEVFKKLSRRANKKQLIKIIEKIKKEINYEQIKLDRDKKVLESVKNEEENSVVFCS